MSGNKTIMASASWCGFSKKFEKQLKDEGKESSFEIIHSEYSDGFFSRLAWELDYIARKMGLFTVLILFIPSMRFIKMAFYMLFD